MSIISPILLEYKLLEEKISWFISYADHIIMVNQRSSELFFRCTEIPRNTRWQDVNIINLVEAMDKSRALFEKSSKSFENLSIIECREILKRVQEQIKYLTNLEEKFGESLKKFLEDLMLRRKNHLESWENKSTDVWLTENALKCSLKNYLKETEQWDNNLKKELFLIEKSLYEIGDQFTEIITTSQLIQKNHHIHISNINHQTMIEQQKFRKDYFFDFPENENTDMQQFNERRKIKFEDEFDMLINDLRSKNENITKDISIRKFGIYRVKRGYDIKIALIIITETRYIHAYDVESIIHRLEIPEDQKILIRKLNELKKGASFFSNKSDYLCMNEEKNFSDLTCLLFDELDVRKNTLKGFPFFTKDKFARLDKERKEIIINDNKTPSIKSLFISNNIKIKAFIARDAFELFYAFCKKSIPLGQKDQEIFSSPESNLQNNPSEIMYEVEENPWKLEEDNIDLENSL